MFIRIGEDFLTFSLVVPGHQTIPFGPGEILWNILGDIVVWANRRHDIIFLNNHAKKINQFALY